MKNKFTFRIITLIALVAVFGASLTNIASAASYPDSASKNITTGSKTYNAHMSKTANSEFTKPITETQVYHTKGTETTIGISETNSVTFTGSGSFTAGYQEVFVDLAGTIGASVSASHSVTTSVSFTIPQNKASGYYRVEHRCPKYTVRELLTDITNQGLVTVFDKLLKNMPGRNAAYHVLVKYQ